MRVSDKLTLCSRHHQAANELARAGGRLSASANAFDDNCPAVSRLTARSDNSNRPTAVRVNVFASAQGTFGGDVAGVDRLLGHEFS